MLTDERPEGAPSVENGMRLLTDDQRREFDARGYLVVHGALESSMVDRLLAAHERISAEDRVAGRGGPDGALHSFGFVVRDPLYLELLDLPSTFPLIWGLLGWNIHMYHCHLDEHPRSTPSRAESGDWHRDGGRQNLEIETEAVPPRLSVKVGYFLSDLSVPGRGNFAVVPGSHRWDLLERQQRLHGAGDRPRGAVELCTAPGDAIVFDRRVYHARTQNRSDVVRRALFLGYTYRWIRERDDTPIDRTNDWFRQLSPVRRQLLGTGKDAQSFWGLGDDTYPLHDWLNAHGLISSARNMRPPTPLH
jgi:ectoine hydroxylase